MRQPTDSEARLAIFIGEIMKRLPGSEVEDAVRVAGGFRGNTAYHSLALRFAEEIILGGGFPQEHFPDCVIAEALKVDAP